MAGTADEGWDDDHGTAVAGPDYLDDVAKSDPDFERSVRALQHELTVLKAIAEVDCPR